jgi:F-type H+-transporting ATPase subunit alpha
VGISVSRVGGAAQIPAMKQIAGALRLTLAQYRELQAFAQFGSDLDATTKQQLTRGAAMVEILKQGQYVPLPVEMQIVHLLAGSSGACDDLDTDDVVGFIADLSTHFNGSHGDLLKDIREIATFKKNDLKDRVVNAIKEFRSTWSA